LTICTKQQHFSFTAMSDGKVSPESVGKGRPIKLERSVSELSSSGFDAKGTTRLLRKIDLALIPFLALLYL
jgi:hypothetical protein